MFIWYRFLSDDVTCDVIGLCWHTTFQPRSQGLYSLPPPRPWLRLVTWPPRIWVAKKSVGWEGWQSILFGWCDKLCGLQILSKQSLNTARSFGVRSRICRWWMLHDFCRLQNIEDFRSQRNSAAEWSRNVLTVSKCERSRTGSKWNQWISLLNLWIRR